jgi:DNA mismatch endonuclease (patch repair protein)
MMNIKKRWTLEEEEQAKNLLNNGKTCCEVSKILERTESSISKKNNRDWRIALSTISYTEKLSRSVRESSHLISAYQKNSKKWSGENNPNYKAKLVKRGKDNPLSVWKRETPGYQDGKNNPSYGRIIPKDEIKRKTIKINELAKDRIGRTNEELYGKETADKMSTAVRKASAKRISEQKTSGTNIELKMMDILNSLNLKYEFQYNMGFYCVDFFVPSKNLIIQVDGCYWHGCPIHFKVLDLRQSNRRRLDSSCDSFLKNRGYNVLRIWGCEFDNLENIKYKIRIKEDLCVL